MSWQDDRNFIKAINFVCSPRVEGGLSLDPKDKGNWTGGEVGKGDLHGTKFGISAAKYPQLDIQSISWNDAANLYYKDYWLPARCDRFCGCVGFVLFDAAVQHGIERAVKFLQHVVGTDEDGVVGPITISAVYRAESSELIVDYIAARMQFYQTLKTWGRYGNGWTKRMIRLAMECLR